MAKVYIECSGGINVYSDDIGLEVIVMDTNIYDYEDDDEIKELDEKFEKLEKAKENGTISMVW